MTSLRKTSSVFCHPHGPHDLFSRGRAVKARRGRFKGLRQTLQRRQTPSARRRLKRLGQRENRWMTDVNHQASKGTRGPVWR